MMQGGCERVNQKLKGSKTNKQTKPRKTTATTSVVWRSFWLVAALAFYMKHPVLELEWLWKYEHVDTSKSVLGRFHTHFIIFPLSCHMFSTENKFCYERFNWLVSLFVKARNLVFSTVCVLLLIVLSNELFAVKGQLTHNLYALITTQS